MDALFQGDRNGWMPCLYRTVLCKHFGLSHLFFFFPLLFFKCLVLKMKLAKPYGQLKWIQEIQE